MKVKQVNGYTIELNRSRESMMQNEAAFPGEAVNTIAVRMYFPEADAQAVCAAVDRVIERTELFRLRLARQAGGYVLRDAGACGPLCACKTPRSRADAASSGKHVAPNVTMSACVSSKRRTTASHACGTSKSSESSSII